MSEMHTVFDDPSTHPQRIAREGVDEAHLSLRPRSFDQYPGQERVVDNLKIYTQAAKMRGRMLDHCLFHGPPGLGKTTLAGIIAAVMDYELVTTSGPNIERPRDLMGILVGLEANTLLFIDEIHRLPAPVEEVLYSAMEDRSLDLVVGDGHSARTVKFDLKSFTLVGATTRAGSLSLPLRERFGIVEHLEYYSEDSLAIIIQRSANILGTDIEPLGALTLAQRSRGTPRVANVLLRRVMDFALVAGQKNIDAKIVASALLRLGVDDAGLSPKDRLFLAIMRDRHDGGPVGLEAVAAAMGEERQTLEDVYEPYLVHKGFIIRTLRGRQLSAMAHEHLKKFGDLGT